MDTEMKNDRDKYKNKWLMRDVWVSEQQICNQYKKRKDFRWTSL